MSYIITSKLPKFKTMRRTRYPLTRLNNHRDYGVTLHFILVKI